MESGFKFKEIRKDAVKVTLKYQTTTYVVFDDLYVFQEDSNDDEAFSHTLSMWEDGNYSCDCNKSLFIQRQHNEDFQEMTCGETVELVEIDLVKPAHVGNHTDGKI